RRAPRQQPLLRPAPQPRRHHRQDRPLPPRAQRRRHGLDGLHPRRARIERDGMAKLYFRYGTMDSAKTMNLLAVAHNYRQQGKRVVLLKPRLDDRFGSEVIASRSGLEKPVDLLLEPDTELDRTFFAGLDCVLVDEAQFLSARVIEQLREITLTHNVPV